MSHVQAVEERWRRPKETHGYHTPHGTVQNVMRVYQCSIGSPWQGAVAQLKRCWLRHTAGCENGE